MAYNSLDWHGKSAQLFKKHRISQDGADRHREVVTHFSSARICEAAQANARTYERGSRETRAWSVDVIISEVDIFERRT